MTKLVGSLSSQSPNIGPLLEDAAAVWRFLVDSGGLDPEFYDKPIIEDIRGHLDLPDGDLVSLLEEHQIGTEDMIEAFLSATEPLARMMKDSLKMFTDAGAKQSAHNMQVRFDFDKKLELSFDLEQFRMWFSTWERARQLTAFREWDYQSLWKVCRVLQEDLKLSDGLMGAAGTAAEDWAYEYMEIRVWPRQLPPPPLSGDQELDRALNRTWRLWSSIVQEWARISRDRRELREYMNRRENDELREAGSRWSPRLLAFLDSDHWGASVAAGLYGTSETVRRMSLSPERADFIRRKTSALDQLFSRPTRHEEVETWVEVLQSFLNLPAWKRRHELYSVWIASQILQGASPTDFCVHVVDERLHFSFGGTHFATAEKLNPQLHFWAELRSPLTVPPLGKGRKGKIQPDYTLIRSPITDSSSAVLVVECKQYRSSSTENFLHALVDYAQGRPDAVIVLVNYGPARREILEKVPTELRPRVFLIGEVRPESTALTEFHDITRSAIASRYPDGSLSPSPSMAATGLVPALHSVALAWDAGPRDLDLSLEITTDAVNTVIDFRSHGSVDEQPWAELDRDAQQRPGLETINLARILPGRYRFLVYNYSNEIRLADSRAQVTIDQGNLQIVLKCPDQGEARWWHVFDLSGDTGQVEMVNTLVTSHP